MNSELKKRISTGVLGAIALLSLLIFGNWIVIFCLVTLLSFGMVLEFAAIVFGLSDQSEKKYVLLTLTWLLACLNLLLPQNEYALIIATFLGLFIYFLLTAKRHQENTKHFIELVMMFFSVIYLIFLPAYFQKIYELVHGLEWSLVFLLINWVGDSGAYFTGLRFGKKKLYPEISPKKTWEGAGGGLILGIVAVCIFKVTVFKSLSLGNAILIPTLVGVTAQIGDLCESFLKRAFGKKDSGAVLPGHGGLLDRFDGVVFSLPVMYACIRVLT